MIDMNRIRYVFELKTGSLLLVDERAAAGYGLKRVSRPSRR